MPSFSYKEVIKRLKKRGFYLYRQGKGFHELWISDLSDEYIPIPHHSRNLTTGTVLSIAKKVGFKNLKDFENFGKQ